jgi:hypothetical protein
VDADWDLAALVIWRPPLRPVPIATSAPRPDDVLTICGYGQGEYREATGRCTQYLAPRIDFPREMVELNVEARQGDSGGPIFNERYELAGVLFGASRGTTLGSFGGRVEQFLASLAPDIGDAARSEWCEAGGPPPEMAAAGGGQFSGQEPSPPSTRPIDPVPGPSVAASRSTQPGAEEIPAVASIAAGRPRAVTWREVAGQTWFQQGKTLFAVVGVMALLLRVVRWAA